MQIKIVLGVLAITALSSFAAWAEDNDHNNVKFSLRRWWAQRLVSRRLVLPPAVLRGPLGLRRPMWFPMARS
jgi:hypothetical protein